MADQSIERTVKNPKLTLMAFQLRNNLALGDEPVETADHLWEKCQELGKILNCPQLEALINRLDQHQGKIGFPPGNACSVSIALITGLLTARFLRFLWKN